jgi:hypothetical protein
VELQRWLRANLNPPLRWPRPAGASGRWRLIRSRTRAQPDLPRADRLEGKMARCPATALIEFGNPVSLRLEEHSDCAVDISTECHSSVI